MLIVIIFRLELSRQLFVRRVHACIIHSESLSNLCLIFGFRSLFELLLVCASGLGPATRRQRSLLRQEVVVVTAGYGAHLNICVIMHHCLIAAWCAVPHGILSRLLQLLVDSDL